MRIQKRLIFTVIFCLIIFFAGSSWGQSGDMKTVLCEEGGFGIRIGKTWAVHQDAFKKGIFAELNKNPSNPNEFPKVSVTLDSWNGAKTLLEFARRVQATLEKKGMETYEAPKEIQINKIPAVSLICRTKNPEEGEKATVQQYFIAMKNGVVCFIGGDKWKNFSKSSPDFLAVASGFHALPKENCLEELTGLVNIPVEWKTVDSQKIDSWKHVVIPTIEKKSSFRSFQNFFDKTDSKLEKFNGLAWRGKVTYNGSANFEAFIVNYSGGGEADLWRVCGEKLFAFLPILGWTSDPMMSGGEQVKAMVQARKGFHRRFTPNRYLDVLKKATPLGMAENVEGTFNAIKYKIGGYYNVITEKLEPGKFNSEFWFFFSPQDNKMKYVKTIIEGVDAGGKQRKLQYDHFIPTYGVPFELPIPTGK